MRLKPNFGALLPFAGAHADSRAPAPSPSDRLHPLRRTLVVLGIAVAVALLGLLLSLLFGPRPA